MERRRRRGFVMMCGLAVSQGLRRFSIVAEFLEKKTASAALKMLARYSTLLRFLPCIYHFLPQKSASQAKSPQPLAISDGPSMPQRVSGAIALWRKSLYLTAAQLLILLMQSV